MEGFRGRNVRKFSIRYSRESLLGALCNLERERETQKEGEKETP